MSNSPLVPTLSLSCVAALIAACGGSAPTPSEPEPNEQALVDSPAVDEPDDGATESEAAESSESQPPAPPGPEHISISEVKLEGAGAPEETVRDEITRLGADYDACVVEARKAGEGDVAGRVILTLLYVAGERKSVAASYNGPGSKIINSCFMDTSKKIELAPPKDEERTVVTVYLELDKP